MTNICSTIPIRAIIALLMFGGTFVSYVLRVNLNIAIVTMTNNSDVLCYNSSSDSVTDESGNIVFCWTEKDKSNLLSAYFYGYIILQIFGGSLAEKFGTKLVLGLSALVCSILSLLLPIASKESLWISFGMRICQGLVAGVTFPSLPPMIMKWAPMQEHSKFVTFTYIGGTFGTMITYPVCGVILDGLGWEAVFYISGGLGLVWSLMWFSFVSDDPSKQILISKEERGFIEENRKNTNSIIGKRRPPYLRILFTPSVWGLMFCDFARSFGAYMIIIEGPNFIDKILHKDILENGILNALPQMTCFLYGIVFSYISDILLKKNYVTIKGLRYLGVGIGLGVPAITVAALGYTTESWILCISVLSIGIGFGSASYMGHLAAVYDIAPTYSGTVYGFVNMVGNTTGFITPLATAAFIEKDPSDIVGWRNLFWLSAGLYIAALIMFPILVRIQPASFEYETKSSQKEVTNYGSNDEIERKYA